MADELKANRYRVEKTGYGFWPYCVRAGDGTRELFKGHHKQCMLVAAKLEEAFEDGKFIADRAQPTSQGGEAVCSRCDGLRVVIDDHILPCPKCNPYTHPADPGAVAVRLELLERAERNLCSGEEAYQVQQEIRALLANSEGVKK